MVKHVVELKHNRKKNIHYNEGTIKILGGIEMKFELKLDKEQLVAIGKGAGKIGKAIIVEGTKAVALKGATAVITQSFDQGIGGVKELGLDDMLNGGKKKKPKKSLFSFNKKKNGTEETFEAEVELEVVDADIIEPSKENK